MSQKHRMNTLRTLADSAERESARNLANSRRHLETEQQRLAQLQAYLGEYSTEPGRTSTFADTVRSHRDFIAQIRTGIEQQEQLVASLRQQLELDLAHWREARSHTLALERYSERLDAQAEEKDARREQGRLDEVGRQLHQLRSA